jgi:hypothetical protein
MYVDIDLGGNVNCRRNFKFKLLEQLSVECRYNNVTKCSLPLD